MRELVGGLVAVVGRVERACGCIDGRVREVAIEATGRCKGLEP